MYGYLFTFGSNKHGQLGLGDFRRHQAVSRVGGVLTGQRVEKVACGDGFTVVSTTGKYMTDRLTAGLVLKGQPVEIMKGGSRSTNS